MGSLDDAIEEVWNGMERSLARVVGRCLVCLVVEVGCVLEFGEFECNGMSSEEGVCLCDWMQHFWGSLGKVVGFRFGLGFCDLEIHIQNLEVKVELYAPRV